MTKLETRHLDLEVRARTGEDEPTKLVGYAAVFNDLSNDQGGFYERILPGAFGQSIQENDIRALADHDHTRILGRTASGTLKIREDKKGLAVEIEVPDTTYGRDLLASVERGDIRGMSFGFRVREGGDKFIVVDEGDTIIRELSDIDLREVSTTSIPAFESSELALRVDPAAIAEARAMIPRPRHKAALRRLREIQALA